ncbi:hypothetical protein K8640_42170 [Myxococcus sp. XM-1-1-1]|nr:hypothetical protein [Myxococcus sp. XM-1-1-1]MBZ4414830.1 hypothetical protein [Myxococcus sp. XM-1-1-1]
MDEHLGQVEGQVGSAAHSVVMPSHVTPTPFVAVQVVVVEGQLTSPPH